MNDSFSKQLAPLLAEAQLQADRLGHAAVYPEHLMLAMVGLGSQPAQRVLHRAGVHPGQVASRLERLMRRDDLFPPERSGADLMDEVLRLHREMAARLHRPDANSAHLLLALLRAPEGLVATCLGGFGITYEALWKIVNEVNAMDRARRLRPPDIDEVARSLAAPPANGKDGPPAPDRTDSSPLAASSPSATTSPPAPSSPTAPATSGSLHPRPFGSCCDALREALDPPPDPLTGETAGCPDSMFSIEPDGVLYLNVGFFTGADRPVFLAQSVLYCPFCGAHLQDADSLDQP